MDEPATSIDPQRRAEIWGVMREFYVRNSVDPGRGIPGKTLWMHALQNGVTSNAEFGATVEWAVGQGLLVETAKGGPGGLGYVAISRY